jgi:NAD+ synthase (glutamine-hydrolysing)
VHVPPRDRSGPACGTASGILARTVGCIRRLGLDASELERLQRARRRALDKNGFKDVVMGLSGGIDSALVATITVDAPGPDRVSVVVIPFGRPPFGAISRS